MDVEALLVAKAVSDFNQHELPKEAVARPAQNDWFGALSQEPLASAAWNGVKARLTGPILCPLRPSHMETHPSGDHL